MKLLIIFTFAFTAVLYGQNALDSGKINEALKSPDVNKRLEALKEVHAGFQKKIQQARSGGTQAILNSTRSFLEPVKPGVLQAAEDENSSVRAMSVSLLGYMTPGDPVENVLIKSLKDKVPDVQYVALGGLYLIGGDTIDSREIIVELLGEEKDSTLFKGAAQLASLWQIPEAIPPMIKALRNNNPFFKKYAAGFLGTYGTDANAALPELTAQLNATQDPALKASLQAAIDKIKTAPPQPPKAAPTASIAQKNKTLSIEKQSTQVAEKDQSSSEKSWTLMILIGVIVVGGGFVIYRLVRK